MSHNFYIPYNRYIDNLYPIKNISYIFYKIITVTCNVL